MNDDTQQRAVMQIRITAPPMITFLRARLYLNASCTLSIECSLARKEGAVDLAKRQRVLYAARRRTARLTGMCGTQPALRSARLKARAVAVLVFVFLRLLLVGQIRFNFRGRLVRREL